MSFSVTGSRGHTHLTLTNVWKKYRKNCTILKKRTGTQATFRPESRVVSCCDSESPRDTGSRQRELLSKTRCFLFSVILLRLVSSFRCFYWLLEQLSDAAQFALKCIKESGNLCTQQSARCCALYLKHGNWNWTVDDNYHIGYGVRILETSPTQVVTAVFLVFGERWLWK